jgi:hypothetical protein
MRLNVVCVVLGLAGFATALPAQIVGELVGRWRLVSCESRDSARVILYPFGEHPVGHISYDARGNMSTVLMKRDRPLFASEDRRRGTDAEVRAAFEGFDAYFGTYSVDTAKGTVTHHVTGAAYPNWVGRDQLRYYKLERTRLVLSTPPFQLGGRLLTTACAWERTP